METGEVSKTPIEDQWQKYAPILEGVPPVYVAQLKSMFEAGAVFVCDFIMLLGKLPEDDPTGNAMTEAIAAEAAGIISRTLSADAKAEIRKAVAAAMAHRAVVDGKAGTN